MSTETGTRTIDQEWRAAEERLGEWWFVRSLIRVPNGAAGVHWEAVAAEQLNRHTKTGRGPTPAEALAALR